jgi:glutathione synthase/RimK-type ligase-like ATP-grasp enzyme
VKVATAEEAGERIKALLQESELVVAQEFVPSDFDWRVGVLGVAAKCPLGVARQHQRELAL